MEPVSTTIGAAEIISTALEVATAAAVISEIVEDDSEDSITTQEMDAISEEEAEAETKFVDEAEGEEDRLMRQSTKIGVVTSYDGQIFFGDEQCRVKTRTEVGPAPYTLSLASCKANFLPRPEAVIAIEDWWKLIPPVIDLDDYKGGTVILDAERIAIMRFCLANGKRVGAKKWRLPKAAEIKVRCDLALGRPERPVVPDVDGWDNPESLVPNFVKMGRVIPKDAKVTSASRFCAILTGKGPSGAFFVVGGTGSGKTFLGKVLTYFNADMTLDGRQEPDSSDPLVTIGSLHDAMQSALTKPGKMVYVDSVRGALPLLPGRTDAGGISRGAQAFMSAYHLACQLAGKTAVVIINPNVLREDIVSSVLNYASQSALGAAKLNSYYSTSDDRHVWTWEDVTIRGANRDPFSAVISFDPTGL